MWRGTEDSRESGVRGHGRAAIRHVRGLREKERRGSGNGGSQIRFVHSLAHAATVGHAPPTLTANCASHLKTAMCHLSRAPARLSERSPLHTHTRTHTHTHTPRRALSTRQQQGFISHTPLLSCFSEYPPCPHKHNNTPQPVCPNGRGSSLSSSTHTLLCVHHPRSPPPAVHT